MEPKRIEDELIQIIRNELKQAELVIDPATVLKSIDQWDSINNAIVFSAVQKHFNIHFNVGEMLRVRTLNELTVLVNHHLKK